MFNNSLTVSEYIILALNLLLLLDSVQCTSLANTSPQDNQTFGKEKSF
jgi:hypothetical protein